jgi:hypothetical protein
MCVRYSVLLIPPAIADFEHVGIVPVTGCRVRAKLVLAESDVRHRLPVASDVAGCALHIPAHTRRPFPQVVPTVLPQTEHDRPTRRAQRVAHFLVYGLQIAVGERQGAGASCHSLSI